MSQILIADDNEQNLYLARFLLEQQGHTITEASNGQEATDITRQQDFELILMDIQMPVVNGLSAAKTIKQDNHLTRIVALTALAMAGDRDEILAAGCDGYIEKPIDPLKFAAQVEKFLAN